MPGYGLGPPQANGAPARKVVPEADRPKAADGARVLGFNCSPIPRSDNERAGRLASPLPCRTFFINLSSSFFPDIVWRGEL